MSNAGDARRILRVGDRPERGLISADALGESLDAVVVESATDFLAAVERVETDEIDCVVTDHAPAGFDGLALLESIRRSRPQLPVVVVPDVSDGAIARRAVAADATAYVPAASEDTLELVVDAIEDAVPEPVEADGQVRMPINDRTATEEQRLKERALDEAPVGITIGDATVPDKPLIYVNDSFVEMTGYDKEEAIGVNCRFLQGEETDAETTLQLREAVRDQESAALELLNYRADGSTFWNNLEISPIRDEDGNVTNFVGFQQDITERKEAEAAIRRERETLRRLLDRVEGLVSDVTEILVRADSRADIDRMTVERIGDGAEFDRAWIGRYDSPAGTITITRDSAGGIDPETVDLTDADAPAGSDAVAEALDRGEVRRFEDSTAIAPLADASGTSGADGPLAGVVIPLVYRGTTYGALAVYDRDSEAFDETERTILAALGRAIGAAVNAVVSKRTVTTDTAFEIEVALEGPTLVLSALAERLSGTLAYRSARATDDGSVRFLFRIDAADEDAVQAAADRFDAVTDVRILSRTDEDCAVEIVMEDSPFVTILSGYGGDLQDVSIDADGVDLSFRVATEQNGRAIVDDLEDAYATVTLISYREGERTDESPHAFRRAVEDDLTDRQLTALQKAYVSGFFEWPRESDGDELADSMDVVPSTYYQHLRTAEKKLARAFFDA
ncbi:Bacterioopsin transcriptional activator protein [Halorhabdus tiamatea SARL4B]|uniref:Bacterio-opsin activator HTH domain protein n=1 Tax=Halorhabdus tiamatea SARL4B TaxID=1033806 RepID=F7PMY2_9EURY|nr:bacterio-opsin activator domain-containing protein [Halorhabdus tiamatea]ERJ07689.1 Bacterioopsin transcriptional activator protein [Halorhabdus tiamatea SARL4B]CCQ32653.1 bacterio-opsin activator HTH domain protein [Halorhabdus tiamatea SARL4B]